MIESDGHQWLSYAPDDAPATADQEDEIVETLTPGRAYRDYVSDFVERFDDAYRGRWSTSFAPCAVGRSPGPAGLTPPPPLSSPGPPSAPTGKGGPSG
jgi:hypothetical protein